MKKIDKFTHLLTGAVLALAVVLLASRAAADTIAQVVQVVQVKGQARYATDNKTWHTLKQGDILLPGVVIQTATHSTVDIQLVDRDTTTGAVQPVNKAGSASAFTPPASGLIYVTDEAKFNIVRIFESSVLAVDKLIVERTSVDEVAETQLDLRAGHIMGNVKKLSAASKYEIKIPNGVAGIRGSFYEFWASGLLKMLSGSSILALVGSDGVVNTWLVNALHGFNPADSAIYPLSQTESGPPDDMGHPHPPPHSGPPPYGPPFTPPPFSTVR